MSAKYVGVTIFERTDFPEGQAGNRFDVNPMVFVSDEYDTWAEARNACSQKAVESLRNGAMVQEGMGKDVKSMLDAADRISRFNNATYSFELPAGNMGEFLVRWAVDQKM